MKKTIMSIAAILLFYPVSMAQVLPGSPLKGLTEVMVIVEDPPLEVAREGITRDQLQKDVELQLKQAGINVPKELGSFLHVNILGLKPANCQIYAFHIEVTLRQTVILDREPPSKLDKCATWKIGGISFVEMANLSKIREEVKFYVDGFINTWRFENSKK